MANEIRTGLHTGQPSATLDTPPLQPDTPTAEPARRMLDRSALDSLNGVDASIAAERREGASVPSVRSRGLLGSEPVGRGSAVSAPETARVEAALSDPDLVAPQTPRPTRLARLSLALQSLQSWAEANPTDSRLAAWLARAEALSADCFDTRGGQPLGATEAPSFEALVSAARSTLAHVHWLVLAGTQPAAARLMANLQASPPQGDARLLARRHITPSMLEEFVWLAARGAVDPASSESRIGRVFANMMRTGDHGASATMTVIVRLQLAAERQAVRLLEGQLASVAGTPGDRARADQVLRQQAVVEAALRHLHATERLLARLPATAQQARVQHATHQLAVAERLMRTSQRVTGAAQQARLRQRAEQTERTASAVLAAEREQLAARIMHAEQAGRSLALLAPSRRWLGQATAALASLAVHRSQRDMNEVQQAVGSSISAAPAAAASNPRTAAAVRALDRHPPLGADSVGGAEYNLDLADRLDPRGALTHDRLSLRANLYDVRAALHRGNSDRRASSRDAWLRLSVLRQDSALYRTELGQGGSNPIAWAHVGTLERQAAQQAFRLELQQTDALLEERRALEQDVQAWRARTAEPAECEAALRGAEQQLALHTSARREGEQRVNARLRQMGGEQGGDASDRRYVSAWREQIVHSDQEIERTQTQVREARQRLAQLNGPTGLAARMQTQLAEANQALITFNASSAEADSWRRATLPSAPTLPSSTQALTGGGDATAADLRAGLLQVPPRNAADRIWYNESARQFASHQAVALGLLLSPPSESARGEPGPLSSPRWRVEQSAVLMRQALSHLALLPARVRREQAAMNHLQTTRLAREAVAVDPRTTTALARDSMHAMSEARTTGRMRGEERVSIGRTALTLNQVLLQGFVDLQQAMAVAERQPSLGVVNGQQAYTAAYDVRSCLQQSSLLVDDPQTRRAMDEALGEHDRGVGRVAHLLNARATRLRAAARLAQAEGYTLREDDRDVLSSVVGQLLLGARQYMLAEARAADSEAIASFNRSVQAQAQAEGECLQQLSSYIEQHGPNSAETYAALASLRAAPGSRPMVPGRTYDVGLAALSMHSDPVLHAYTRGPSFGVGAAQLASGEREDARLSMADDVLAIWRRQSGEQQQETRHTRHVVMAGDLAGGLIVGNWAAAGASAALLATARTAWVAQAVSFSGQALRAERWAQAASSVRLLAQSTPGGRALWTVGRFAGLASEGAGMMYVQRRAVSALQHRLGTRSLAADGIGSVLQYAMLAPSQLSIAGVGGGAGRLVQRDGLSAWRRFLLGLSGPSFRLAWQQHRGTSVLFGLQLAQQLALQSQALTQRLNQDQRELLELALGGLVPAAMGVLQRRGVEVTPWTIRGPSDVSAGAVEARLQAVRSAYEAAGLTSESASVAAERHVQAELHQAVGELSTRFLGDEVNPLRDALAQRSLELCQRYATDVLGFVDPNAATVDPTAFAGGRIGSESAEAPASPADPHTTSLLGLPHTPGEAVIALSVDGVMLVARPGEDSTPHGIEFIDWARAHPDALANVTLMHTDASGCLRAGYRLFVEGDGVVLRRGSERLVLGVEEGRALALRNTATLFPSEAGAGPSETARFQRLLESAPSLGALRELAQISLLNWQRSQVRRELDKYESALGSPLARAAIGRQPLDTAVQLIDIERRAGWAALSEAPLWRAAAQCLLEGPSGGEVLGSMVSNIELLGSLGASERARATRCLVELYLAHYTGRSSESRLHLQQDVISPEQLSRGLDHLLSSPPAERRALLAALERAPAAERASMLGLLATTRDAAARQSAWRPQQPHPQLASRHQAPTSVGRFTMPDGSTALPEVIASSQPPERVVRATSGRVERAFRYPGTEHVRGQEVVILWSQERGFFAEPVDQASFRPEFSGNAAVLVPDAQSQVLDRALADPAMLAVGPGGEPSPASRLRALLSHADSPETQLVIIRTFASRGALDPLQGLADVERFMRAAEFLSIDNNGSAMLRLAVAHNLVQMHLNTCAPTTMMLTHAQTHPLDGLTLVAMGHDAVSALQARLLRQAGAEARSRGINRGQYAALGQQRGTEAFGDDVPAANWERLPGMSIAATSEALNRTLAPTSGEPPVSFFALPTGTPTAREAALDMIALRAAAGEPTSITVSMSAEFSHAVLVIGVESRRAPSGTTEQVFRIRDPWTLEVMEVTRRELMHGGVPRGEQYQLRFAQLPGLFTTRSPGADHLYSPPALVAAATHATGCYVQLLVRDIGGGGWAPHLMQIVAVNTATSPARFELRASPGHSLVLNGNELLNGSHYRLAGLFTSAHPAPTLAAARPSSPGPRVPPGPGARVPLAGPVTADPIQGGRREAVDLSTQRDAASGACVSFRSIRQLRALLERISSEGYTASSLRYLVDPAGNVNLDVSVPLHRIDAMHPPIDVSREIRRLYAAGFGENLLGPASHDAVQQLLRNAPHNMTAEQIRQVSELGELCDPAAEFILLRQADGRVRLVESISQPGGSWHWTVSEVATNGETHTLVAESFDRRGELRAAAPDGPGHAPPSFEHVAVAPPPTRPESFGAWGGLAVLAERVENTLEHLSPGDIAAVAREVHGISIPRADGSAYDHIDEMMNTRRALRDARDGFAGALVGLERQRSHLPLQRFAREYIARIDWLMRLTDRSLGLFR